MEVSFKDTEKSPSELIYLLNTRRRSGVFTCGMWWSEKEAQRSIARLLVKSRKSSAWQIEKALDLMEQDPYSRYGGNAEWLVAAYAKINGPSAFPRLRRIMDDRRFDGFQFALDSAAALSLNLSSYVEGSQDTQSRGHHSCTDGNSDTYGRDPCPAGWIEVRNDVPACTMSRDPRDNLDKLFLNWAWNDRTHFEEALGPRARAIPGLSLGVPGMSPRDISIGYRFEDAGAWGKPYETLEEQSEREYVYKGPPSADIQTIFVNRNGVICGSQNVQFVRVSVPDPRPTFTYVDDPETHKLRRQKAQRSIDSSAKEYVIDNANLADLLQTFRACAVKSN